MNLHAAIRKPRTGSTLIEMMIALGLLIGIMGSVLLVTQKGSDVYEQEVAENAIQAKAGRGLDKVLRELTGSGAASLNPTNPTSPFGTDTISFQRPVGWAGGAIEWSPIQQVAFEIEESELDNGLDDDGDDLVDEGMVVLIESPGQLDEKRSVLMRGVRRYLGGETPNGIDDNGNGLLDESGLSFERVADVLVIRLSIEGLGAQRTHIVKTVESSTQIRN